MRARCLGQVTCSPPCRTTTHRSRGTEKKQARSRRVPRTGLSRRSEQRSPDKSEKSSRTRAGPRKRAPRTRAGMLWRGNIGGAAGPTAERGRRRKEREEGEEEVFLGWLGGGGSGRVGTLGKREGIHHRLLGGGEAHRIPEEWGKEKVRCPCCWLLKPLSTMHMHLSTNSGCPQLAAQALPEAEHKCKFCSRCFYKPEDRGQHEYSCGKRRPSAPRAPRQPITIVPHRRRDGSVMSSNPWQAPNRRERDAERRTV